MEKYKLIDATVLVISGPVGSGKTMLAREIAGRYGRFSTIGERMLRKPNSIANILAGEPDVVIIDGIVSKAEMKELKSYISSSTVAIFPKNSPAKVVKTPKFILCTGEVDALRIDADDRRFRVIEL